MDAKLSSYVLVQYSNGRYSPCTLENIKLLTLAGMLECATGASIWGAKAAMGWVGDRMVMGDVSGNGLGAEENGETGSAMLDIIYEK